MASIDVTDMVGVNLDTVPYETLQLNGVTIWEKLKDDLSFNYVGIDAVGRFEGDLEYDGVAVEYGIGKRVNTYYKRIVPTPTTIEEYYDNYIVSSSGSMLRITEANAQQEVIVPGDTLCYEATDDISGAEYETHGWVKSGAFNSDYYNYDFSTSISISDANKGTITPILPDDIIVPSKYKQKNVTRILPYAISSGLNYSSSGGSNMWECVSQAYFIKGITLPNTIKHIGSNGIHLLGFLNYEVLLPEGLESIAGYGLANCNTIDKKIVLPTTITTYNGNSIVYDNIHGGLGSGHTDTIVIKSANVELATSSTYFDYAKTLVFENSVESITGCLGYSKTPNNFVFRHTNTDTITLNLSGPKSATEVNLYTDNDYIKSYDWASKNYTVTIYPLSDYVE